MLYSANCPNCRRSYNRCVLALCWLTGLIYGIFCAYCTDDFVFHLMDDVRMHSEMSAEVLLTAVLPFLISALSFYGFPEAALFFLCFSEAFLLSFCAFGFIRCHNSAGWLIYGLHFFRALLSAPLIYFYWLRKLSERSGTFAFDCFILSLIILLESICCIFPPNLACLIIL